MSEKKRYYYCGLRVSKPRLLKKRYGAGGHTRRVSCVVLTEGETFFPRGTRIRVNRSAIHVRRAAMQQGGKTP